VVSKNGNMLLNVPGRGDGTIDDEVVRILEAIGGWLKVNGEAIYGTRPWLKFGEGPNMHVTEDIGAVKFTANDFRFTTKGKTLYAIALGWAEGGKWLIGSLASIWDGNRIESVQLLGYDGKLKWQQTNEGLLVEAPPQKPCECAFVLKIEGQNLKPAR
jgi:alpha-L-fucosidase